MNECDPVVCACTFKDILLHIRLVRVQPEVLIWAACRYDFGVFAFLAPSIGKNFFPPADPIVQIIDAFIVFAGGFIMRPIGGVLFGHIGDIYGRKKALMLSVVLMAGSTLGIGCLPTYHDIGILATVLLAFMRLLQGLSVGGEFVGSLVFAVESAPPEHRVLAGSVCTAAATGGVSLGSWTGLLLSAVLSEDEMRRYGWRLPFFGGTLSVRCVCREVAWSLPCWGSGCGFVSASLSAT